MRMNQSSKEIFALKVGILATTLVMAIIFVGIAGIMALSGVRSAATGQLCFMASIIAFSGIGVTRLIDVFAGKRPKAIKNFEPKFGAISRRITHG